MSRPRLPAFLVVGGLVAAIVLVALLPWWRNHAYLRDLYDYGLVWAANGNMDRGERPYVDFTTPIQAGFLGLNWAIERTGGGTYAALTRGAAALIVLSGALLTLMLARRWPWWAAAVVGATLTLCGPSQHTILWHNALGLFTLTVVAWGAASAPVLRRESWPWHTLVAIGLAFGGINKLNFHLVAIAAAIAWAIRAGLVRQASWRRVAATVAAVLFMGVVLPVAAELAWTGASLSLWLANVVQLASGSRVETLGNVLSHRFLFEPIHDYYGQLPIPQVGLAGLVLTLATLAGCWPSPAKETRGWDRWLVPVAVLLAALAGAALLATNFEIGSLGLGAWLALLVSLWLGFAPAGRRRVFVFGLLLPTVAIGAAAWWSAWKGQRSQFGYSIAPREEYLPVEKIGPAFVRLKGLWLPPDVVSSLEAIESFLPPPEDEDNLRPVFWGPGLEFLDRSFPSRRDKRQPLWGHWGTSYGPSQMARLAQKLDDENHYRAVFVTGAFDSWPTAIQARLEQHYVKGLVGPRIRRWTHRSPDVVNFEDSFETLAELGGNVPGRFLVTDRYPLETRRGADGKIILGTTRRDGSVLIRAPIWRVRGVAVLSRMPGSGDGPLRADFKAIVHGSSPEDQRWSAHAELPVGQAVVRIPFEADISGGEMQLWVSQSSKSPPAAFAGYRELEIIHAGEDSATPSLRPPTHPETAATSEAAASLFGSIAWRPERLVVRGGQPTPEGLQLLGGGELWLHTTNMTGEIVGRITRAGTQDQTMVRVVWYKGGRLQPLQQTWLQTERPFGFHAWTAEPGGWIGIIVDPTPRAAPVNVRILRSTLTP